MNHRSHTRATLMEARACGERAYALDTGDDGLDDVLVGHSPAEILRDVADFVVDGKIPAHWTVDELTWEQALEGAPAS